MRLLVVGGTGFLGGAVARRALNAGHEVTVLSRGRIAAPEGAKTIVAERSGPLPDLAGFDAVVDTCAYRPDQVTHLLDAIGTTFYVLVSSISAYGDMSQPMTDETAETPHATPEQLRDAMTVKLTHGADAAAYGPAYGPLKASCEGAAANHPTAVIRLGLIVGPRDYTDRFTWWVRRMDMGGIVPVPIPEERLVQLIDVGDAAKFLLHLARNQMLGTYNVTGQATSLLPLLRKMNPSAELRPLPLSAFTEAGVRPWNDLPLILPEIDRVAGMMNVSIERALGAGLTFRPIEETIEAIRAWDRSRRDVDLKCGLTREQEAEVLKA